MNIYQWIGLGWLLIALSSVWTGKAIWTRESISPSGDVSVQNNPLIYSLCCGQQLAIGTILLTGHFGMTTENLLLLVVGTLVAAGAILLTIRFRANGNRLPTNTWAMASIIAVASILFGIVYGFSVRTI